MRQGHEALDIGGQGADARLDAVGGHEDGVGAKQRGDLLLVGLKLVERHFQGGVLIAGVFELDYAQGQAVDKYHDVGAAVVLVLDGGELIEREPVVVFGVAEVD